MSKSYQLLRASPWMTYGNGVFNVGQTIQDGGQRTKTCHVKVSKTLYLVLFTTASNMSDLETWVNDKLHDILGISEKYIGQFIIGLAKKANSSETFLDSLKDTGAIDVDTNVIAFSKELWDKVF